MKALAFQEPYATEIILGAKTVECRTRSIKTPVRDLIVCASKTAHVCYPMPGLVYGYAIGLVDIVGCVTFRKRHLEAACMDEMPSKPSNAWILENARAIKPFPVSASASFFYVDETPEVIAVATPEDYKRAFLDIAHQAEPDRIGPDADEIIAACFEGMFFRA